MQLVFVGLTVFACNIIVENMNKIESSLTEVTVGSATKFSQRWFYSQIRTNSLREL